MEIKFKNIPATEGAKELATRILSYLNEGKRVLWLLSGGSNVSISVEVLNIIKKAAGGGVSHLTTHEKASNKLTDFHGDENLDVNGEYLTPINLKDLTVTLTDERYSSINHPESNWRHLKDAGFDFDAVTSVPVLVGKSFEETTKFYGMNMRDIWNNSDVHIGQFGIGTDGHIAGVLPKSGAVRSPGTVFAYEALPFKRLTITLSTIEKLEAAYVFAYGLSKREALNNLFCHSGEGQNLAPTIDVEPAQILKQLEDVHIFTDQV